MTWFTQLLAPYFFHPAFAAAGATLVAAPIIIHLINRMRYRRVRFAAMEFLLQSQQRNRRRILLEQLLLLLLRILIVLALAALIARLILDPSQMSLLSGARSHHVVLLDDSGSMRDRDGETTAFDEALKVVKDLVADGARRPDTQKFTLLLASDPEQPLFAERNVNDEFVTEAQTKLENLKCSHRAIDLAAGLEAARRLLADERGTMKYLHVVSDFRQGDWGRQRATGEAVAALDAADVNVNLVRTVSGSGRPNLAITDLGGDLQIAAAGVPLRLSVKVKNFGATAAKDVRLTIRQNGQRLPQTETFDKIDPGEELDREFDVPFDQAGQHTVEVALEPDSLLEDNVRHLAVDVAPHNPVLIIDGDPSGEEAFYLATALAPDTRTTGFAPLVEGVDYLRRHPLDRFQCIFLVNVPELPADALEPLKRYVAGGGGLAWFVGDLVRPGFYNDRLYDEGNGLFPVPLASSQRELRQDDLDAGPDLFFARHPMLDKLFGQENPWVHVVRVRHFLSVADDWVRDDNRRQDGVRTLGRLRNRYPFLFEHQYGQGRIVTWLTSAGPTWNNWANGPGSPSFVITQLELTKYITRLDRVADRRQAGVPIELDLDPAEYLETVEITAPDGETKTRLKASPRPQDRSEHDSDGSDGEQPLRLFTTYRDTDAPGVYALELLRQDDTRETRLLAYNFPVDESDLAVAADDELRQRIGEEVRVAIQPLGSRDWLQGGKDVGQEVRKMLLFLLVGLLLCEQLLAYRLSYHPKTAGATA